jgi:hypothetical protein
MDFWRTDIQLDSASPYNTLPLGRHRIGRGGRLLIDRPRWKPPFTPARSPIDSRWKFDNFGEPSDEEDFTDWQSPDHLLDWRLKYAWSSKVMANGNINIAPVDQPMTNGAAVDEASTTTANGTTATGDLTLAAPAPALVANDPMVTT